MYTVFPAPLKSRPRAGSSLFTTGSRAYAGLTYGTRFFIILYKTALSRVVLHVVESYTCGPCTRREPRGLIYTVQFIRCGENLTRVLSNALVPVFHIYVSTAWLFAIQKKSIETTVPSTHPLCEGKWRLLGAHAPRQAAGRARTDMATPLAPGRSKSMT